MKEELQHSVSVAALAAVWDIVARPHGVVFIEVTCPDGMMTAGGIAQPGIEVGEGKISVRQVVDVEDLKLMGCCVECNGGDMG